MKFIGAALLAAQKTITNPIKNAENTAFGQNRIYKYATLENVLLAVKKAANENGIVIAQSGDKDEQGYFLKTTLLHAESGESISSKCYLMMSAQTMQGLGSAWSYARRYSLAALFAVGSEDDDGQMSEDEAGQAADAPKATNQPPVVTPQQNAQAHGAGATAAPSWSEQYGQKMPDYTPDMNLGEYVVTFGKKPRVTGLKLKDAHEPTLISYYKWALGRPEKDAKCLEFVAKAGAYLLQINKIQQGPDSSAQVGRPS